MYNSISQFYKESGKHIEIFNAFSIKHLLKANAKADHICYKCASTESFDQIRAMFEKESTYLYQTIISGRRIAYIKMKKGIETILGTIYFLELSDQKPDSSQKEGFDHIEVFPTASSYEHMVQTLQETENVIHVERPHHTTDDIDIGEGFLFRCTQGQLLDKIKASEFV